MFILLSISFASAAQNETHLTDDEKILTVTEDNLQTGETDEILSKSNDDNLTADVGTYSELEDAFQKNDKFVFEKDYAAQENDGVINIKKSIEIDGNGHTIDARGYTGIFQSDSKESNGINVVIKNLIFKNGVLLHGGAIYVDGPEKVTYTLQNCTFINNTAWYEGGAIYFWGNGNILDVSDSKFIKNKNSKDNGGGAIYLNAESTGIRNSIFENNSARSSAGGAINIDSKNTQGVLISNCNFNNNQVTAEYSRYEHRKGGAINYEGKSTLRVINSNFTNNQATLKTYVKIWNEQRYGGAICSINRLELGGCNFINNSAVDRGGAVHADTLVWLNDYNPCTFINNSIKTWNHIAANKGGAIYASTFENNAYGLTFINNTGYYGGAIFINNKNDVTFQSCYFEGNTALTETKAHGSGAAIYVDSSGSKVTLVDNIFLHNKATSDSGVFNCGKYGTVANNWWGNNNPDFKTAKYIVEWHRVGSNNIISDDRYLRAHLNATESQTGNSKLTVYFTNNKGEEFTGKLTNWNVEFSSDKDGVFTNKEVTSNRATVSFTTNAIQETVSAKINNQILMLNITQTEGDFAWLQKQIDTASGTFDLTRDVIYTIGLDTITDGIKIEKPITINGNGHKINAQGKSRIFDISDTSNVVFNNITFMNGFTDTYAGAIKMDGVNDVKILNSNFINNTAEESCGAVLYENGKGLTISNCEFTNNKNDKYFGGAIRLIRDENVLIEKSKFTNNTGSDGGAIAISGDKNITIDGCEFRLNTAFKADGGAIYNDAEDVTVKNSIFLNNKANADSIEYKINDTALTLAIVGGANYINAIKSDANITFSNVTYWNGKITTDSNPVRSSNESGINMALVIKDSQNRVIKNVTLTTDANGQAVFNFDTLMDGKYSFNATHFEDSYYTQVSEEDEFTVANTHIYPSEVKINIENGTEFTYGNVNISFEVKNKTFVEVVITNSDFTHVFYDNETNLSYVIVDLPASDEYYNIIVFNHGNETYEPTSAEKAFKILKTNSTVKINPIADVKYSDPVTITFSGDTSAYNVTLYDAWGNILFSRVIDSNSIKIPGGLAVGTYNVTVVNLGDENRTQSKNSTKFNVTPAENRIVISADDAVYGQGVVVYITATADGEYTAYINSTNVTIHVDNGYGSEALNLAAGTYTTNVSFYRPDYINVIETYNFTVTKAQSNVDINVGNVTYGQNTTVFISDDFPAEYNVIIFDSGNNIVFAEVINETSFVIPPLEVGQYNLTVTNIGNENITGSETSRLIEVTKDNYVQIIVEDSEYGRELLIIILADADGYYNVDINGTQLTIEVKDGFGYDNTTELDAGEYYANVTYDNPDYNNIIENTTFTIYQAQSNVQIGDIENITYGENITIEYYDNYNARFNVVIFDENEDVLFNIYTYTTTLIVSDLAAGNYFVMVTNEGNKNIIGTSEFKNFTVYKATPKMKVTCKGNEINVELPENATGEVSTIINGKEEFYPVVEGIAIIPLYHLKPGNYSFDVKYSGDKNYTEASGKTKTEISKITPEMTVNANLKEITVQLPDDATGNVKTTINGKEIVAPVSKGKATIQLDELNPGNYTFDVRYSGDDYYYPRTEKASVSVPKIDPMMNASFEVNEIVVELPDDATGNVSTTIDGVDYSSPVVDGLAIIPLYDLKPGNYTLDVKYSGDDKYFDDGEVVDAEIYKVTPEMTVESKDNVVDVVLPSDVSGDVTVVVGGKEFTVPVKDGKASITVSGLDPGNYSADVKYSGDDYYNPRTEKADITIPKITPDMKVHQNNDEVIVELPEDATGNVILEINGEKLTSPVENGKAEFSLDQIPSGEYDAKATYSGDDKYQSVNANEKIIIDGIELITQDVIKYYHGPERLVVTLVDNDKPLKSKKINITLNGITYSRITDDKGQASLGLNLDAGNYTALVVTEEYSISTLVDIEIKSTVYSNDLVKMFRNATQFHALFLDSNGNPLANANVEFNIHGVFYTRTTNASGWAKLNINLSPGKYIITANNTVTGESKGYNITVLSLIESEDLIKYYKNDTQFVVRVHSDDGGWAKDGEEVLFNINGMFYVRITNETGHAKLNINLRPTEYLITADCKGCNKSNSILVLPVLTTDDLTMYYKNGSKFAAKLVDGQGKAYPNQNITFNVNGVFYTRTTDANGEAKLNINLGPGKYIITTDYNGCQNSDNILVLPVLTAKDLTMKYKDGSKFTAKLVDGQGKVYPNQNITFNVNGVLYTRTTDANGEAKLNINLMAGEYIITSGYNGAYISNKITITS